MLSYTQSPFASPASPGAQAWHQYEAARRSHDRAQGLEGARRARRNASTQRAAGQAPHRSGASSQIGERQEQTGLGRNSGTLEAPKRTAYPHPPQTESTGRAPAPSQETDRPRPHGIFEAFVKTCQRWRLHPHQQTILLGHSPKGSLGAYILNGQVLSPSVDTRERATRVFEISLGLGTLFDEDPDIENEWLRTPRAQFANTPPLDHMLEGHMEGLRAVAELVRDERGL